MRISKDFRGDKVYTRDERSVLKFFTAFLEVDRVKSLRGFSNARELAKVSVKIHEGVHGKPLKFASFDLFITPLFGVYDLAAYLFPDMTRDIFNTVAACCGEGTEPFWDALLQYDPAEITGKELPQL